MVSAQFTTQEIKDTLLVTIKGQFTRRGHRNPKCRAYDNRTPKCMKGKLIKLKGEMETPNGNLETSSIYIN